MLYNHVSAIILNLLFFQIDRQLKNTIWSLSVAFSPVMDCTSPSMQVDAGILLRVSSREIAIHIMVDNFTPEESDKVHGLFAGMIHDSTIALNIVCKKNFSLVFRKNLGTTIYTNQLKEIVLSVMFPDGEKSIHILLPFYFFRLFSNSITPSSSARDIEDAVLRFFTNPRWMLPDISYLFNALTGPECITMINYLQKKNLLTPYQIFLLIQAYPELSGTIKNALSQNIINDVIHYNKDSHLKITKRDIAGGIYSIEESLLMIASEGIDVSYSRPLRHIQHIIQLSLASGLVLKKNFSAWLSEIQSQDLLHATVSTTDDAVMAAAISRESDTYLLLLKKSLSERKVNDIKELIDPSKNYEEIMKARSVFLSNFRKLKMQRIPLHPDRLEYLLSSFSNPDDYQYLLFSAGWFVLSTALKGINKKIASTVIGHLPLQAGILIEDVLRGIVNPNILHDEMQIKKARIRCVGIILQLYYDGRINLE